MINDEEARTSPLIPRTAQWPLHSPSRRERREALFCFFPFVVFSLLFFLRRRRRRAGPPRNCASDCSRETDGAARSTNRAAAFQAPSCPYPSTKMLPSRAFPSARGDARSPRFYPLRSIPYHHHHHHHHHRHHHHPSGGGSTCVLRLRSFVGVPTFDAGVLWQD